MDAHFKKAQIPDVTMPGISVVGYLMRDLSLLENTRAVKALVEYNKKNTVDAVHLQFPQATVEAICAADNAGKELRVDNIGHACLLVGYARTNFDVFYAAESGLSSSLDAVRDGMVKSGKRHLYEIHMEEQDTAVKAVLHKKGFHSNT